MKNLVKLVVDINIKLRYRGVAVRHKPETVDGLGAVDLRFPSNHGTREPGEVAPTTS